MIYQRIYKQGLCPADLNNQVMLLNRRTVISAPGTSGATMSFDEIGSFMCGIETRAMVEKVLGININQEITHFFYFNYSARLKREPKNTYIRYRNEYYRLISVENVNEQNRSIIYAMTNRGETSKAESKS